MGPSAETEKGAGAQAIGKNMRNGSLGLCMVFQAELGRKLFPFFPIFLETGSHAISQVGLELVAIPLP